MGGKIRKFLLENEAVTGIDSPLDYLYVKMVRSVLYPICIWPEKELGETPSKIIKYLRQIFISPVNVISITPQVAYLIKHNGSAPFLEVGHMYLCVFITINIAVRYFSFAFNAKYREVMASFFKKFHIFHHKNKSDYAMKIHKRIHLISHLFTIFVFFQFVGGATLFNLIPMYNNYSAGNFKASFLEDSTYEYAVFVLTPFNNDTDIRGYIFTCILGWILSFFTSIWFCIVDLILCLMVFHIYGHFKILINTLENFPVPKRSSVMVDGINVPIDIEMYSESESIKIADMMKECINYHRDIVIFTDKTSRIFGFTILAYLFFHQISGCLLLLECSQMTAKALMRYLPLTLILFQQLVQISVVFELIGSVTDKLSDVVYGLPWQYMNTKNRRTFYIFLIILQKPIHIKALGFADVGVETMAKIVKTSLSYFTFLRTMK